MNKSGIYQILNLKTQEKYIGSAVNLHLRKTKHFWELLNNRHHNVHLQRSYNKHGINHFEFKVLEYVSDLNSLLSREQYYLDLYFGKSLYNTNPTAGSFLEVKQKQETIDKRVNTRKQNGSYIFTEQHRKNISKVNLGKVCSEETRQKHRLNSSGEKNPFYGKKHSEESKKKISEGYKNMSEEKKASRSEKLRKSRLGKSPSNKGIPMSEEQKLKISISKKKSNLAKISNGTII